MSPELIPALISFCVVSSVTPGPNNMMLLSSGATWGFRRTLPHMLGISGGCGLMVLLLGWALAGIVQRSPNLYAALHWASAAYLLWLAWRIATSSAPGGTASASGRPFGFFDAAGFQWVNPKAWAMVLGAVTSFARPETLATDVVLITLILITTGLPCIALWAAFGTAMKQALSRPGALRLFNLGMAALLVASILPGLFEQIR